MVDPRVGVGRLKLAFGYLFLVKPSKQDKQCDAAEEQANTDNKALRQEGQFQVMGATWDRHTDKAVLKGGDWNFFAVKRSSPALVIRDGRYKLLLFSVVISALALRLPTVIATPRSWIASMACW